MSRAYGGRTADARAAERRERLMSAGMRMWADGGWAAVTVRGVCAGAGLTERYFYESFADREALLLAILDDSTEETIAAVLRAVEQAPPVPLEQLRAAIGAFVYRVRDDPRHAKLALTEPVGSPALQERRRAAAARFVDLITAQVGRRLGDDDGVRRRLNLAAQFCVGGLTELLVRWLSGDLDADAEEIVDRSSRIFEAVLTLR